MRLSSTRKSRRAIAAISCLFACGALGAWYWTGSQGNPPSIPPNSVAAYLLEANSRYQFNDGVARRGYSTIHRLDPRVAWEIDNELRKASARSGIPVAYLAAYVRQESTGDPKAEYRNAVQWDAAADDRERFAATDLGLVQINGRNLLAMFPDMALGELRAKAEDIGFATAFLVDLVSDHLKWASEIDIDDIPEVHESIKIKAKEPLWLAALAYNRGRGGALKILGNPIACRHADLVMSAMRQIEGRITGVDQPDWPVASTSDGSSPMAFGEISSRVEGLQSLLNTLFDTNPKLSVDGNFGAATRSAVTRFQEARGLPPTGVVDDVTWSALASGKSDEGGDGLETLVIGSKGARVRELQRLLNLRADSNTKPLIEDGVFGRGTRDAIARYQHDNGLDENGLVDAKTWASLKSEIPEQRSP